VNEEVKKEKMDTTTKKTTKKQKEKKGDTTLPKVKLQKLKDLEGKFLLVKVGTSDQPATTPQIEDVQEKLVGLLEQNNVNCVAFVTHHAVSMEIIEKQGI